MIGGPWLRDAARLVVAVTAVWLVLWGVAVVAADPPLSVGHVVVVGVLATDVLLLVAVRRGWTRSLVGSGAGPDRSRTSSAVAAGGARLAYARDGLTIAAAHRTAQILHDLLDATAVAVTDRDRMLAFVGAGADHHAQGSPLYAPARRDVLTTGTAVVTGGDGLGCPEPTCPLDGAVIAPLVLDEAVVGTVTVYVPEVARPPRGLVEGIAAIISLHLQLADVDHERRLSADARLDALRAQIDPHFLFNTLNTIASKARTDADEAREMLLRLADFFRYAIDQHGHRAPFAEEYFFVRTYLALEQARFGDRLDVSYDIDPQVLSAEVPVLTVQPLVENAVRHGLSRKVGRGRVRLRARLDPMSHSVELEVRDDGVGMSAEQLELVRAGRAARQGSGVGVTNIAERLELLYGDRHTFEITSTPETGTTVLVRVPA